MQRDFRQLKALAETYNLEFVGRTRNGHYRWRHRPTGRFVVSISQIVSWRSLKNTERTFRQALGRHDGQYPDPH